MPRLPRPRDTVSAWFAAALALALVTPVRAENPVDFDRQVKPIFARACLRCHGPEKQRGGLRLDVPASARKGGDSGEPAVKAGDVEGSPLLERVATPDDTLRMPPRGERLAAGEVALLRRWVAEGANWPEPVGGVPARASASEMTVTEADRDHWAFRPLRPVEPPPVRNAGWPRSAVDRFILAAQEAKGLAPAPEADRRTLIRRLSFDLIGLPPDPADSEAFVNDRAPDAFERLVDRLLASPRYGERWGRHWLDVARYADSDGYEGDLDRKTAWRYRDFVITALNEDMPFDRFARLQLAGDQFEPDDARSVAATGFLAAAPCQETTPADTDENKAKIRYDELDNVLSTAGSAFLGLTVGCARCHDHKFDPIPTRDYYRMLAAFDPSSRADASLSRPHRSLDVWLAEQKRRYREAKMAELGLDETQRFWLRQPEHFFVPVQIELYRKYGKALSPSDDQLRAWMDDSARSVWRDLAAAAGRSDGSARGLVWLDRVADCGPSYLLGRGSMTDRREQVTLGFLQVLTRGATADDYLARARQRAGAAGVLVFVENPTYRRAALAEWLTDTERGAGALAARVVVNRLWQHHFGEGLVRTPDDFGATGDRPANPDLLDHLAGELLRNGWRLKPLHRLIVTSAAYRQATDVDPAHAAVDPENRLLWHRRPVRLESEALRDALLSASGRLDPAFYGPAFRPPIPAEAVSTRSKDTYPTGLRDGPANWRRSVYAFVKRSVPLPASEAFDAPDPTASCGRRNTTAVPTQSLALLNDPFVRLRARDLARRASREAGPDADRVICRAYALALGRPPRPDEREAARAFLSYGSDALEDFCHVLFTLNEFLYVD